MSKPDSTPKASRRKTPMVLRILALMIVVVAAIVVGGGVSGAIDNTSHPTCAAVRAFNASGTCFKGSKFQADAGLAFVALAAVAMALAVLSSLMLLIRGTGGGRFLRLFIASILLLALGVVVTKI